MEDTCSTISIYCIWTEKTFVELVEWSRNYILHCNPSTKNLYMFALSRIEKGWLLEVKDTDIDIEQKRKSFLALLMNSDLLLFVLRLQAEFNIAKNCLKLHQRRPETKVMTFAYNDSFSSWNKMYVYLRGWRHLRGGTV